MSPELIGLLIGGVFPAITFGVSNLFMKVAAREQISIAFYMIVTGISVIILGFVWMVVTNDRSVSLKSGVAVATAAILWGIGASGAMYALRFYHVPIGKIAPLFNANSLITVLLALWIFSEWQHINVSRLILGTLLIVVGSTLVARA